MPDSSNTRQKRIAAGKIWHVYRDDTPDDILFEGSKTACMTFITRRFGMRAWRTGVIRVAKIIWEDQGDEHGEQDQRLPSKARGTA